MTAERLGDLPEAEPASPTAAGRPTPPKRRWLFFALKLAVSATLIAWILSRADLSSVFATLSRADRSLLLLLVCVSPIGIVITTLRWRLLLRAQSLDMRFPYLFGSVLVGIFFRQFLPSTVGGDAVRAYDTWRAGASTTAAIVVLGVERLLGLLAMVSLAAIGIAAYPDHLGGVRSLAPYLLIGLLVLSASVAILFTSAGRTLQVFTGISRRLPRFVASPLSAVLRNLHAFQGKYAVLRRAIALSLLLQIHVIFSYFLIARALRFPLSFSLFFTIVPIAILVMLLPLAINGIGVRESIFIYLLGQHGITEGQALAFAWLEYSLFLLLGLAGGIIYAGRGRASQRKDPAESDSAREATQLGHQ